MRKYLAEFLGTFVLVFGGVGSAVLAGSHIGYVGVAFAFGLSLLAMVYTIGPISGCHVNPAVTLGVLLAKRIGSKDAIMYVVAQIFGAIVASALILFIASGVEGGYNFAAGGLGANGYGAHSPGLYSMPAAFVAEVILTMFLVVTVLGATDVKAPVGFAGLAIGLVLTLIRSRRNPNHQYLGESRSQHRTRAIRSGLGAQQLRLFIVAPLLGAALAAFAYAGIRLPDTVITTPAGERALASEQAQRSNPK